MSVVVIGMDMPTNCLQCSFVRIVSNHYYCGCNANCMLGEYVGEYLEGVGLHEGCPLVELPKEHGRLIDADKLKPEFPYPKDWRNPKEALVHLTGTWVEIDCAETVVEREGD